MERLRVSSSERAGESFREGARKLLVAFDATAVKATCLLSEFQAVVF
jgi:hypothetical protein